MAGLNIIPLSEPDAWRDALRGIPHAFGHTWESCHATSLTTGEPTFLFAFENSTTRVVCPLAERRESGYTDVYTPWGFSGFAGNGSCPELPAHWHSLAFDRGYVCGFIGLNPLFYDASYGDPGELFYQNSIFVLDLRVSDADLFQALSENRKRAVRASARAQWTPLEDRASLRVFFMAHCTDFLRSKKASAASEFSEDTLAFLSALDNVLMLGAGEPDRIEAVSVFAYSRNSADYLFGISLPEGQRHAAPLIWHGALRLKALGIPLLNLGGGIRAGDGVAGFKARFGARELPLGALKQVYDPRAYAELCRAAGKDPAQRTGYFPRYRAPRQDPERPESSSPPASGRNR